MRRINRYISVDGAFVSAPRQDKHERKLTIRLSENELKRLSDNAKASGLTKSAYLRIAACGYIPKAQPAADYFAMRRELNCIGNNLNQIAKVANSTGRIDSKFYREQVEKLDRAILEINNAVTQPERIPYGSYELVEN